MDCTLQTATDIAPPTMPSLKSMCPRTSPKQSSPSKKQRGDKPKRPLSAYNLFFRFERERILRTTSQPAYKPRRSHGKIGFAALARQVAEKWKSLDQKSRSDFEAKAALEKERYDREIDEWNRARIAKMSSYIPPGSKHISKLSPPKPQSVGSLPTFANPTKIMPCFPASLASMSFNSHNPFKAFDVQMPPITSGLDFFANTNNLLQTAANLCDDVSTKPNQEFAPLPAYFDDQKCTSSGSTLENLASLLDDECYDILTALKSSP